MSVLLYILASTFLVSAISFVGVITLSMKEKLLDKMLILLISFSAGALMGGAFLHLLPEAVEMFEGIQVFLNVLVGFVMFFFLEKLLFWRHCHNKKCGVHTFTYLNLAGDAVHNFIDGLVIAAGFVVSIPLGIATVMAIIFHEIPQEIGDFGVLIYGGMKKVRALYLNFIVTLTAVAGGLAGYFVASSISQFTAFLLPIAAGGFIYIASSDLIPEICKIEDSRKSLLSISVFLLGIIFMWVSRIVF